MMHLDIWQIALMLICSVMFVAFFVMAFAIFSLSQELDRRNGDGEGHDEKWKK